MSTKKLSGKRILVTAVVLAVAVALAAPAWAQQAPIKWKAQTLWNAQERPQKTFEDFCKRVKVLTNGRLEIEPYPAGAIVPTNETLTALQSNVLQAIHVWPGYASGRNPAFAALCDFIFAYEQPWELDAFMHYKGGLELLRELYKPFGAYTVGVMTWGVESWPSKKPIRNMDDFKGLKIREPQGMEAEFMAKAGASVVSCPAPRSSRRWTRASSTPPTGPPPPSTTRPVSTRWRPTSPTPASTPCRSATSPCASRNGTSCPRTSRRSWSRPAASGPGTRSRRSPWTTPSS